MLSIEANALTSIHQLGGLMVKERPIAGGRSNEGCNSCASLAGLVLRFIACFILLVIAPLGRGTRDCGVPTYGLRFAGPAG